MNKPKVCKVCKVCRQDFTPTKPMQRVCSGDCAISLAVSTRGKAEKVAKVKERKTDQAKRESMKTRADWSREAQASFNAWIRARDADRPCISCGRHHQGQYHAGHYLSVGARPELRYEPLNVWKQCAPCNTHLSGNAVLFRVALVREIGIEKVEWLEGPHEPKRYTVEQLQGIKKHYAALVRKMRTQE